MPNTTFNAGTLASLMPISSGKPYGKLRESLGVSCAHISRLFRSTFLPTYTLRITAPFCPFLYTLVVHLSAYTVGKNTSVNSRLYTVYTGLTTKTTTYI